MEEEDTINVVIKTINNDVYNIPVTNSTPIHQLKDAIRESTTIEIDRQRLIYRGKVLTDESFVRDYNIEDGHTVHMVARPANYREIQQSVNSPPQSRPVTETPPSRTAAHNLFASMLSAASASRTNDEISDNSASNISQPSSTTPATANAATAAVPAEPNLEYLRQGLLTMHTLFSTIDTVNIPSSSTRTAESKTEDSTRESKPSANDSSISSNVTTSPLPSERRFFVGQWLDVKDTVSQWLEATILDIDDNNRRIFVHYNGWPQRWDEWIAFDSPRVAPFRSRTNHAALSANLSPSPNISVAHAPATGVNDIRTILPELANLFRMLQPVVEELGELSQESLRHSRPTQPADARYASGMPWNQYLNNNNDASSISDNTNFDQKEGEKGPEEKYMDLPDAKDTPIEGFAEENRFRSQEEVDARLQLIARDACPLFDRFGRILSDISPHLWNRAMPGINRPTPANRFDPFQSLESRLLSLLRERPPSPPPIQAYRAPITSQGPRLEPIDMLRTGILRAAPMPSDQSESNTASNNTSSNEGGRTTTSGDRAAGRRAGLEHHVDIHIAIVSPQPTNRTNVDSLSRTVANLTASLQAQAQHLAARTQELSERTSAVSEITSAITEALRNNGVSNGSNNNTETQTTSIALGDDLDEEVEGILNPPEADDGRRVENRDNSLPSLTDQSEDREESLDDLNISVNQNEDETSTLMPSEDNEGEVTPFYNISNQRLQSNYGTVTQPEVTPSDENAPNSNENGDTNEDENTEDASPTGSSRSLFQRLRRSFFSSR